MWHVSVLILSLSSLVYGAPQVPCYFIFGDSLYDNGNNHALITKAKTNYPPYGIDFPTGPVGRFTNGRNTADILAELLGFETYIPPFASASGQAILKGVNYASGAAGILDETGQHLGARISFNKQLINHQITLSRIKIITAINQSAAVNLRECLYTVGIGNNDYIGNYFSPFYPTRRIYTPEQYATVLVQQYSLQLKTLHDSKARKVAVFGIGALGCTPAMITMYGTNGSLCVDFINSAVQLFNAKLVSLVDDFNNNLSNAKFIYINSYQIALTPTPTTGLSITNIPCCNATNKISFQCIPNQIPCSNRNDHVFWDAVHPTEAADVVTTRRAYNALLLQDTRPYDIQTLATS
ncbi:hypothetical protein Ddye_002045 [Dipteronia dyeriana]|uniref:Uncharacterized protein n=1 Tax=Dipteronia dyeriana TaxID=168575 RepID=A0AAD9XQA4_9ROSI|nr:hypothetical protein Ddye_002045 [Dipteronia dyeriana]